MSAVVWAPAWISTAKRPRGRLDRERGTAAAFVHRQEDPLAGRAKREDAVEAGAGIEVVERAERALVERRAAARVVE